MVDTVQTAFSAGEISNDLMGRVDLDWYRLALAKCRNAIVHPHGGVSNRGGTKFVGSVYDHTKRSRLIEFQFSNIQTYILEFGHYVMRVIKDGGFVLNGSNEVYELVTPYAEEQVQELNFVQSADVMYFVHRDHPPKELIRYGHDDWEINNMEFTPVMSSPASITATASNTSAPVVTYKYVVTAENESGNESMASNVVSINCHDMTDGNENAYVDLSWPSVSDAVSYSLYKEINQSGVFGWIGRSENLNFRDKNIAPDNLSTPIITAKNPFSGAGNYPAAVSFYEERLVFASTTNNPQTIYMSHTGRYNNFSVSKPARDDEAVTFTPISRKVSVINNLVDLNDLILLTDDNEWRVHGGDAGSNITPSSINPKRQTGWGSAPVTPLLIGDIILYIQRGGRKVRALGYSLESDGYKGNDLTIRVPHFFEDGAYIADMAYSQEPHSIVWCVLSNGKLAAFTYIQEQNVWAWHYHETDGEVENVSVITESGYDVLYMVVKRVVGGSEVRYIEKMDDRRFVDVEDAFFVDCGLTYSGVPIPQIASGLEHLEGREVAVLADGNVQNRKIVVNGGIELDRPASKISVGLPYTSYIKTLRMALQSPGAAQNKRKVIKGISVRVKNTRGIKVGQDLDNLQEVKPDYFEPNEAMPLFTGDLVDENYDDSWDNAGQMVIAQDHPLPMTVVSIMPDVRLNG